MAFARPGTGSPHHGIRPTNSSGLDIYWWKEPTSRDRQETVHAVALRSPIPVATGEMYDTVGQFYTLAAGGGFNIFQPEPMSLGGIAPTLQVANFALAHGSHNGTGTIPLLRGWPCAGAVNERT